MAKQVAFLLFCFLTLLSFPSFGRSHKSKPSPKQSAVQKEARAAFLAEQAYIFGYPLVLMSVTKDVMTATPTVKGRKAPLNQFIHLRKFPGPALTEVVSPNVDTLYSVAWLDLTSEPIILSVPDTEGRYYLMPTLDAWTNVFASPGKRTTGTMKGDFAFVGPSWSGLLPAGVKEIRSPTNLAWILGRTQCNGKSDYEAVNKLQDQYKLTPLSSFGKEFHAPREVAYNADIDSVTPPVEQVGNLTAPQFYEKLNHLMIQNPPADADAPILGTLAAIGISPGQSFSLDNVDASTRRGIERGFQEGINKVAAAGVSPAAKQINGWMVAYDLGSYGIRFLDRAAIAKVGLGANLAKDAIYPMSRTDSDGKPLSGEHQYVLHFDKEQIPPVNAFWSVTLYNNNQFLVANPIKRYAVGDRDKLKFNDDGSLDIPIQHDQPKDDLAVNWLPAPQEGFNLIMRLYWPKEEVINGSWTPPSVKRVIESSQVAE